MIVAHGPKRGRIHGAVAQEFIGRSMEPIGSAARDNVYLSPARSSHVGCVAAGFNLELHDRVGRRTQVLGVEGRVGIGGAIEQEEVGVWSIAANPNRGTLPGAPI